MKFYEVSNFFIDKIKNNEQNNGQIEIKSKYKNKAYKNVSDILLKTPQSEVTYENIDKLPITEHMKDKIIKFSLENSSDVNKNLSNKNLSNNIKNKLLKINGIGDKKANELISNGLQKISQLKEKKFIDLLNTDSKKYLNYNPNNKIPHEIISKLEPILVKKSKYYKAIIVGSFRRKKEFSSDIDVMLVSKNMNCLDIFLDNIKKDLEIELYNKGTDKMSLYIIYKNNAYKIDAFRTDPNNEIPMLLYTTGSKINNIIMRSAAKKKGFLLNQKGLFDKKTNEKVKGLTTEKKYYDFLGLEYKEPQNR